MSRKLLTVAQAAAQANVTPVTIYYHLNRSFRLFPVFKDNKRFIRECDLGKLYPGSVAGVKQKLGTSHNHNQAYLIKMLTTLHGQLSENPSAGRLIEAWNHTLEIME